VRKAQDLIGLSVVVQNTGKQVGVVRDLYFDASWRLQGLIVENKGLLRRAKCIPIKEVAAWGEDAIMVHERVSLQDLPDGVYTLYSGQNKLTGKDVMTTAGDGLGQIQDVYFVEEMGNLIGCELSEGILSDLRQGRKIFPWPEELTIGEDMILVPEQAEARTE